MITIHLDDKSRESQFTKAMLEKNTGVGRLISAHGGGTLKSALEMGFSSDADLEEEEEDE